MKKVYVDTRVACGYSPRVYIPYVDAIGVLEYMKRKSCWGGSDKGYREVQKLGSGQGYSFGSDHIFVQLWLQYRVLHIG